MMTAAQARQKAREIREQAAKQPNSNLRYEMTLVAEQFEQLAAELERIERER